MRLRVFLAVFSLWLWLGGCDACTRPGTSTSAPAEATTPAPSTAQAGPARTKSGDGSPSAGGTRERELTWVYQQSPVGLMHVVVSIPERASQNQPLPVLIALHGRGEALRGPVRGARGWIDDYWMPRAIGRLKHPPLKREDLLGMVDPQRLARMNESLARKPYRGLIVVCPYTPDIWAGDQPFSAARPLTRFVVDELLPRVYRDTPALGTAQSTGIDGVSLGGRAALLVGLNRPKAFGTVAALQPAFSSADAPALVLLARQAKEQNPKLKVRLLTSLQDFYLVSTRHISRALSEAGVPNTLDVIPGVHDYDFNRGPGVYEMLLFHDRALRGEAIL